MPRSRRCLRVFAIFFCTSRPMSECIPSGPPVSVMPSRPLSSVGLPSGCGSNAAGCQPAVAGNPNRNSVVLSSNAAAALSPQQQQHGVPAGCQATSPSSLPGCASSDADNGAAAGAVAVEALSGFVRRRSSRHRNYLGRSHLVQATEAALELPDGYGRWSVRTIRGASAVTASFGIEIGVRTILPLSAVGSLALCCCWPCGQA